MVKLEAIYIGFLFRYFESSSSSSSHWISIEQKVAYSYFSLNSKSLSITFWLVILFRKNACLFWIYNEFSVLMILGNTFF